MSFMVYVSTPLFHVVYVSLAVSRAFPPSTPRLISSTPLTIPRGGKNIGLFSPGKKKSFFAAEKDLHFSRPSESVEAC